MNPELATAAAQAADMEAMDSLLDELDLGGADDEIVIEEIIEDETVMEAVEADIETAAVYDEQIEASTAPMGAAAEPAKPAKTKAAKAPKEKKAASPKIERDLTALPDTLFVTTVGAEPDRAAVMAVRPSLKKKVVEKFDNFLTSLNAGKAPSVYVMQCFATLDAKKEVTATELQAAMKAHGKKSGETYSDGTVSSQVGQIMSLFPALGIAAREKNKLTLIGASAFAERLRSLA